MKSPKKIVVAAVFIAFIFAVASIFIPYPEETSVSLQRFRIDLMFAAVYTTIYVAATSLYVSGALAYKEKFKRSFVMLSIAYMLSAVGVLQTTYTRAFGYTETDYAKQGWVILPLIISSTLIYVAIRNLAKILSIKSYLNSFILVAAIGIGVGVIGTLMPHMTIQSTEAQHDSTVILLAWQTAMTSAAAFITLKISQNIGTMYVKAMSWMALSLFVTSVFSVSVLLFSIVYELNDSPVLSNFLLVAVGASFAKAGYELALTRKL